MATTRMATALFLAVVAVMTVTAANRTATREQCYTFYVSPSRLAWPDGERGRENAERTGAYVPRNVLFTKVEMLGSKAFVLSPRYRSGVPFTVGHFDVADPAQPLEPFVVPFPSTAVHECSHGGGGGGDDDGGRHECLANAVDFALDDRGVLWTFKV